MKSTMLYKEISELVDFQNRWAFELLVKIRQSALQYEERPRGRVGDRQRNVRPTACQHASRIIALGSAKHGR
ncbi:unnamed protein product [Rhizoctonia solani]|uniref:Uncharacterized protein n=1 Tax=Rhizoctonia solani TaxID=456999 RepID=A0A8H3HRI9_9AGAM|nr:unnamed protein product [Rhizoctonia solani]